MFAVFPNIISKMFRIFITFGLLCGLAAASTTTSSGTSAYAVAVKKIIDSSSSSSPTCAATNATTICGSATKDYAYYEEFTYKNWRVIIITGVPSHDAEYGQTKVNPNTRCVIYQYILLPSSPSKGTTYKSTALGAIGLLTTGTILYNPLSNTDGSMASYYEFSTLDPCYGHSSPDSQYHYHAYNATCFSNSTYATDSLNRVKIGYAIDGYPIFGSDSSLTSCWSSTASSPTSISQFTYSKTSSCQLDEANGYTWSDGVYGYVLVSKNYYVPYYLWGSTQFKTCGFTP